MERDRGSFGLIIVLGILVFVYWQLRRMFGIDPMSVFRGIDIGVPLGCVIAAAVVLVLWAGKFFGNR
jgi:hypothetical protein